MESHDLAIRWSDESGSLQRIRRLGGTPLHARPAHFNCPGGTVAVVQGKGNVALLFEAKSIDGPRVVTLADNQRRDNGYVVRAKPGTIRTPQRGEPSHLGIRWHAVGQFRYFDARSGRAEFVGDPAEFAKGKYLPDEAASDSPSPDYIYAGGIPGLPRSDPEAQLVDAYVYWMGCPGRFGHAYLPSDRLFTDLFDRSCWRLIEAKASVDRFTLRTAVGQLYDYKRFFDRRPSLGILLPQRPTDTCLQYLADCRVTVIWKTPKWRFSDSSDGMLWTVGDRRR